MDHLRSVVFFSVLFFLSGCAWLGLSRNTIGSEKGSGGAVTRSFVKTGKIIDAERLKRGGKLLIVPFKAGVDVEANEQSDKIALMIVKGIADELKEHGPSFQILGSDNAQKADFIMTGYVTTVAEPSRLARWILMKSQRTLSVEGRMVEAASNKTIMFFTDSAHAGRRDQWPAQPGHDIGNDIGRFIVSVREEPAK